MFFLTKISVLFYRNTHCLNLEEQSATSQEIAQNIVQLSSVTDHVDEKIIRNKVVCEKLAKDAGEMDESINEVSEQSTLSKLNSEEFLVLSKDLQKRVNTFKV